MDASTRLSWRRVCWSPPGWLWTRREAIDFALKIKLRNVIVRLLPFPFIRRSTTFSREKDDGIWAQLHSILVDSFLKDQQYTKRRCKLKIFNGFPIILPIIFPLFSHDLPIIWWILHTYHTSSQVDGETVAEGGRFVWFNSALQKDRSIAVGCGNRAAGSIGEPRLPVGWPSYSIFSIGSMYDIYANIGGILMVNVTIYSIHGSYGLG